MYIKAMDKNIMLNDIGVSEWLEHHDCEIEFCNSYEDCIRKRWHKDHVNIWSLLVYRRRK